MSDWQQRLVDEKYELLKRIQKLQDFLKSEKSELLNLEDLRLLQKQELAMLQYSMILSERIGRVIAPYIVLPTICVMGL